MKLSGGAKEELLGVDNVEVDAGETVVVCPGGGGRVTPSLSPRSPWGWPWVPWSMSAAMSVTGPS